MIVQLAGLPGTGKASLAAELVHRLDSSALLLDKDRVRHALFGPQHILYIREQDDFCVITMFRTAAWHLRHAPGSVVILDGRTCSRAYQVTQVRRFATRAREPLRLIECVCADTIIEQRLRADIARATHPATNRDVALGHEQHAIHWSPTARCTMLISFEGLPGAGKSTQAALLAACLTRQGLPAVTLRDLASHTLLTVPPRLRPAQPVSTASPTVEGSPRCSCCPRTAPNPPRRFSPSCAATA